MGSSRFKYLSGPLIALATILALLGLGELTARVFLPSSQTVEIQNVSKQDFVAKEPEHIESSEHIDSVFEWGHQGIRLHPNISATIRNHILSHQDIRIDVNSLGLRYEELPPKEPGEYRVLVLGDSITIGDYVQYAETYPAILEALAQKDSKHKVRFINAGLPGASLSSEIYRYLEVRDAIHPDLVLVGTYLNDSVDSQILVTQGLPRWVQRSALLSWLFSRLSILRQTFWKPRELPSDITEDWKEDFRNGRNLHSGDMFGDRDAMDFEIYNAPMDFGLAWNPRSWDSLEAQFLALREAAAAGGSKLAAFLLPVHFQVKSSVEDFRPQRSFLAMCSHISVPCFDTLPGLRAEWARTQENLYYDHCHYRPEGNRVVAGLVYAWLRSVSLIP